MPSRTPASFQQFSNRFQFVSQQVSSRFPASFQQSPSRFIAGFQQASSRSPAGSHPPKDKQHGGSVTFNDSYRIRILYVVGLTQGGGLGPGLSQAYPECIRGLSQVYHRFIACLSQVYPRPIPGLSHVYHSPNLSQIYPRSIPGLLHTRPIPGLSQVYPTSTPAQVYPISIPDLSQVLPRFIQGVCSASDSVRFDEGSHSGTLDDVFMMIFRDFKPIDKHQYGSCNGSTWPEQNSKNCNSPTENYKYF